MKKSSTLSMIYKKPSLWKSKINRLRVQQPFWRSS